MLRSALLASALPLAAMFVHCEAMAQTVGQMQTDSSQSGGTQLDEILVTAERRAENLQRVPIAVSALDSTIIEQRLLVDTKSIVFNAPNLTGNNNVGQSTATTFFIRGIGTTENFPTADTSVGLYLDDVYVSRQAANNFALFDIERIEVLRGPQGTLYGRNTNGGAVKIVTKRPDENAAVSGNVSYGNYDRWEAKLSANAPLSSKVFVRGSVLVQQGDGYIRNLTLGKDVNNQDYVGGRLALRAILSDAVELNVSGDYGRDKTNGGYASDIGNSLRPRTASLFQVVSGLDARGFAETYGVSGRLSWDPSDTLQVQSITGWRRTKQDLLLDLSDQPLPLYILDQRQDAKQFSQEFQANAELGDRAKLVAGAYFFDEKIDALVSDLIRATPVAAQGRFTKDFSVHTRSYAAFGQIEFALTDTLTLLGAGRYTDERKRLAIVQTSSNPGPLFNFTTADLITRAAAGQTFDANPKFSRFTPKVGLNWQVSDDLFAYASWTRGFRSGGWTGRALRADQYLNFSPESVSSWEAGAKATLFDRRVRWNSAAFYMDYTNLFNTLTVAGAFTAQTADARVYGAESELTVRAAEGLDLFANVGLLDTKYKEPRPINLADRLQRAPAFQGKIGFSLDRPVGPGNLLLNADLFYTSRYIVTPANLAFTAPLLPSNIYETGDFALVNASIGYGWGDGRYRLSLSCSNCFNEEYFDAMTVIGRYAAAYAGAPRFYRVNFAFRF